MGSLREWNEALVAHFLSAPQKNILFNVTQDVISNIHGMQNFAQSSQDPIEDFLRALCDAETGYGKKIDDMFNCKTEEKRNNGWPKKPENVFSNAYELRWLFEEENGPSPTTDSEHFKFPDVAPPWTSHLALAVLAVSMNLGLQPGNSRYPMIADLFAEKMGLGNDKTKRKKLAKDIQDQYTKQFFGGLIRYRNYRSYPRPPRIVRYYHNKEEVVSSPWGVLYQWAKEQSEYPGTFYAIDGTITDPVTIHSRFREKDRAAMLRALQSLSSGVLPSNQVLDQVIISYKSDFRQSNINDINNYKLVGLRDYALGLWKNNQREIRAYSPSQGPISSSASQISEFQVMPYLFVDLEENDLTKRVQSFFPRLHHTSGPPPVEGEKIEIGEHIFEFYNSDYADSRAPLRLDSDLDIIRSKSVIEITEGERKLQITSFNSAFDNYTNSFSHVVLTEDLHGMYEWLAEDDFSDGLRILKDRYPPDALMTKICGFKIGLIYDYKRPSKANVHEFGRTKIKLDGGSKISGGTDRRYHFQNPPHFVITRGLSDDVTFLRINPEPDKEGNRFLKKEPTPIKERGKTIWKLFLKDDIFSENADTAVVKILYKMETEEAVTEVSFTVVKGVDHWQLHGTAEMYSNFEDINSGFDDSIFTDIDSCKPISHDEAEQLLKDRERKDIVVVEQGIKRPVEIKTISEPRTVDKETKSKLKKDAKKKLEQFSKPKPESEPEFVSEPKPEPEPEPESEPVAEPKGFDENSSQRARILHSVCTSCGVPLVDRDSTNFPCPGCGARIGRCARCRNNGVHYYCNGCEFNGP